MPVLVFLALSLAFSSPCFAESGDKDKDHTKKTLLELLERMDKKSSMRPTDTSAENIDRLVSASFLDGLDPTHVFTVAGDLKGLEKKQPFSKMFCDGSVGAFKSGISKMLERLLEKEKWLDDEFEKALTDTSDVTIPQRGWQTPAKDSAELKARWGRQARLAALRMKKGDEHKVKIQMEFDLATKRRDLRVLAANAEKLNIVCLNAIAQCNDNFARYNPNQAEEGDRTLAGNGFPITTGFVTKNTKDGVTVVGLYPDSAAAETKKLKAGDIIEKIEVKGRAAYDFKANPDSYGKYRQSEIHKGDEFSVYLKGAKEAVTFKASKTISGDDLVVSADYSLEKGKKARWISIPSFNRGHKDFKNSDTSDQVRTAVMADGDVDSYVIDLRGNGGGYLTEALKIAAMFLPDAKLRSEGYVGSTKVAADLDALKKTADKPVVLLVDDASASASEVLAGLLQKHGKNVVIGSTTFGKGIGQWGEKLRSGGELHSTTFEFFDRCGKQIQAKGIKPDFDFTMAGLENAMGSMSRVPKGKDQKDAKEDGERTKQVAALNEALAKNLASNEDLKKIRKLQESRKTFVKKYPEIPLDREKFTAYQKELRDFFEEGVALGVFSRSGNNLFSNRLTPYEDVILRSVETLLQRK